MSSFDVTVNDNFEGKRCRTAFLNYIKLSLNYDHNIYNNNN